MSTKNSLVVVALAALVLMNVGAYAKNKAHAEQGLSQQVSSEHSIDHACKALVTDYAYYRDRYDAQNVANLFTEDAAMSVQGETYNGRQAIYQRMVEGRGTRVIRHMMSTIRIFPVDADNATGVSYVAVYGTAANAESDATDDKSAAPSGAPSTPVQAGGYLAIGEYHDKFVRTAVGWKISERIFVPVFTP